MQAACEIDPCYGLQRPMMLQAYVIALYIYIYIYSTPTLITLCKPGDNRARKQHILLGDIKKTTRVTRPRANRDWFSYRSTSIATPSNIMCSTSSTKFP